MKLFCNTPQMVWAILFSNLFMPNVSHTAVLVVVILLMHWQLSSKVSDVFGGCYSYTSTLFVLHFIPKHCMVIPKWFHHLTDLFVNISLYFV